MSEPNPEFLVTHVTERGLHRRCDGLLHAARSLAAEVEPERIWETLLATARDLAEAQTATVYRWDEAKQILVRVHGTFPNGYTLERQSVQPGQGMAGRVAATHQTVIENDYQHAADALPVALRAGVRAGVGVPVLYEGRLLGVMTAGTTEPQRRFNPKDAEVLEMLAGLVAATLVGLERSRLKGVLLAARTAAHHINNELSLTVGYGELLANDPRMPAALRPMALEALRGAQYAAASLQKLQHVARLEEDTSVATPGPEQTLLDLDRSSSTSR